MAFSDAFARGYAIGDAMKKRRAASNFFEKFQSLSDAAENDADDIGDQIQAKEGIKLEPAAPTTVAPAIPLPSPVAPASTPGGTAAPQETEPTPPDVATAREAIPMAPVGDVKVDMPAIPKEKGKLRAALDMVTGKEEPKTPRSWDPKDIEELDRLALDAARAAGDPEVYTTLRNTTDSFLKSKITKNLGLAASANNNGDIDTAEKYLKRAYRFIPDGQEIKFEKKDGQLWVDNPWDEKDGKIPMTSENIGYIGTMIHDPEKWAEIVRAERHAKKKEALEEREAVVAERGAATQEERTGIDRERVQNEREASIARIAVDQGQLALAQAGQKYDNLAKAAQAARDYAEAEYAAGGKGAGGAGGKGMSAAEMRQYGEAVNSDINEFLAPPMPADPNNIMSKPGVGAPPKGYEMFVNVDETGKPVGGLSPFGLQAKELGGAVGIANPELGSAGAARAGMEITRAMVDPNGPKLQISPRNGTVAVPIGGRLVTVNVPEAVMRSMIAAAEGAKKKPAATAAAPATAVPIG